MGTRGVSSGQCAGHHQVREPPCLLHVRSPDGNENLCPFGAMINVVFNYLESPQQVLITEPPPVVSTCHTVPLAMLTPHPLALLN